MGGGGRGWGRILLVSTVKLKNLFNIERGSIMQVCCHFKTQKCLSVSRNKDIIVKFVMNYLPSAIN